MSTALVISTVALRPSRARMVAGPALDREASMADQKPGSDPLGRKPNLAAELTIVLIRRAQCGDEAALNALFSRYRPRLVHWATGRLPYGIRSRMDTQDLVQKVLISAFHQLPTFEPQNNGSFAANLRKILKNKIIDAVRENGRTPAMTTLDENEWDPRPNPIDTAIGREDWIRYERACDLLSEKERELIFLRIELGCTFKEIADVMGLTSPDAARMAFNRAVKELMEVLSNGNV